MRRTHSHDVDTRLAPLRAGIQSVRLGCWSFCESARNRWLTYACLLGISAFFAVFHSAAWCDEASYVDPAANLAAGRGFFSSCWVSNPPHEFWSSSNPGTSLLLAGWFAVVGFGQAQARLFFFLVHLPGILLLQRWLRVRWRIGLADQVLFVAIALFFQPIVAFTAFSGRPDAFALLLCGWFLHIEDMLGTRLSFRFVSAVLLGVTAMLIGLQFCGYFALLAAIWFVVRRDRTALLCGTGIAAGFAIGTLVLWAFFSSFNAWDRFLAARFAHLGRALYWAPRDWHMFAASRVLAVLFGAYLVGIPWVWLRPSPLRAQYLRVAFLACAVFIAVPLVMSAIGIFYIAYVWMVGLPMALLLFTLPRERSPGLRTVLVSVVLLLCAYNCVRWIDAARFSRAEAARHRQVVQAFLQKSRPGEPVASTFETFYELRATEREAFFRVERTDGAALGFAQEVYLPSADRQRIRWIVASEERVPRMVEGLRGDWDVVARIPPTRAAASARTFLLLSRRP